MAEQGGSIVPVVPATTTTGSTAGGGSEVEGTEGGGGSGSGGGREYRKGNWTLQETMILIQAKKMDDERRLKGGDKEKGKSAEFRWKWVENYCWKNGCQRSQNQCNDKWDNLLRDYKKVREYESKLSASPSSGGGGVGAGGAVTSPSSAPNKSYWQLEKHERKERGLPSNMITQVYEALHEVVDKRPRPTPLQQHHQQHIQLQQQPPQQQQQQFQQQQQHIHHQQHIFSASQIHQLAGPSSALHAPPPPAPPPPPPPPPVPPPPSATEASKSTESEGSEDVQRSPTGKRRKVSSTSREHHHQGLAPTVSRSAYEISQTLLACEEKKDKRHQDMLNVEERKLVLEENKTEISRQGMEGLISAVNNLANAILTLASDRHHPPPT